MIRDAYLDVQLRLHLPDGLVLVESAAPGVAEGHAPRATLHVVTAWNPHGQDATETDNRRAQRALLEHLSPRGATVHPAAGADPAWLHVEPSVAVAGLSREEAVALGAQFGQDAIFEWTPDALTVVSCTDGSIVTLGWRQLEPDARATAADRAWRHLGTPTPYEPQAQASKDGDRPGQDLDALVRALSESGQPATSHPEGVDPWASHAVAVCIDGYDRFHTICSDCPHRAGPYDEALDAELVALQHGWVTRRTGSDGGPAYGGHTSC